jgi:hypothetical protein
MAVGWYHEFFWALAGEKRGKALLLGWRLSSLREKDGIYINAENDFVRYSISCFSRKYSKVESIAHLL